MALQNNIPGSIKVSETPLTSPIAEKITLAPVWAKWFSQIGTFLTRCQENKAGDLFNGQNLTGTFRATRVGNIVQVAVELSQGDYQGITVSGIPVAPVYQTPACSSDGTAILGTDGILTVNAYSETPIFLSLGYIAAPAKEN